MPASDASNFFKRRSRRSPRPYEEYYGEQSNTNILSLDFWQQWKNTTFKW